jgi:hypothetical protein
MDAEKIVKGGQEQAVAAWVNYLNQVRLDRLVSTLAQQDKNWEDAMKPLSTALSTIKEEIIERNRGGTKGMHGFIAEIAECGIGNARQQIEGKLPNHVWINDNGPVDIMRGMQEIQQKFVQSGGHLSLRAIIEHMRSYPDYLSNGGTYQIPQDHYERIKYYLSVPESVANKMPTSTGEFSLKQWKEVHEFFASGNISFSDIEPSAFSYGDAQADAIVATFDRESDNLSEKDQVQRNAAYQESKPSLAEGAKVTVISAGIEGATSFGLALVRKRKAGRKFSEFNNDDWLRISGETGKGTLKGGIRGLSMYGLTNYTATPAAVASAVVTASFGVAEQAHLYRTSKIDQLQFIENSELLCVDATLSALSSFAGQVLIPIPVLGAVIGNTAGTLMYQIAKDKFSEKEQAIINGYLKDIEQLDAQLSGELQNFIAVLISNFEVYVDLVNCAFSPDVETALNGSANLAKSMGVPTEEILDSREKIVAYFMD